MKHAVIWHRAPDVDESQLDGFVVAARTRDRAELMNALSSIRAPLLVIDLDDDEAVNTIIASLEQAPNLGIVGVTAGDKLDRVIGAQRAGCRQVSTKPIDPSDLVEALRRAAPAGAAGSLGRTVGVIGATGGAGATMLACHLVIELARQSGRPALLADLDLDFGGVARAFDMQPQFTMADLARSSAMDHAVLEKSVCPLKGTQAFILARPGTIEDAHAVHSATIREALRLAREHYANVLMDLPRKLDEISGAAMEMADILLVVVQLTVPSVDNALRLLEALRAGGVTNDRVRLVVNRYRRNVHACTLEMVQKRLSLTPLAIVPSDFAAVHQAFDAGEPLPDKHPVRSAVAEIAQNLLGLEPVVAKNGAGGGGWLQKLGIGR